MRVKNCEQTEVSGAQPDIRFLQRHNRNRLCRYLFLCNRIPGASKASNPVVKVFPAERLIRCILSDFGDGNGSMFTGTDLASSAEQNWYFMKSEN